MKAIIGMPVQYQAADGQVCAATVTGVYAHADGERVDLVVFPGNGMRTVQLVTQGDRPGCWRSLDATEAEKAKGKK